MVRKQRKNVASAVNELEDIFGTQEPEADKPSSSATVTVGMRVRKSTASELDQIVREYELENRSGLLRYIVRWWLREYRAGRVQIEFEQTRTVKIPE